MTRRRAATATPADPFALDPMGGAVFKDTQGIAGDLETVMAALTPYDQSSIKGILYKKPYALTGQYQIIENVLPPIDMDTIVDSLKARFGGGDYRLTIFAGGKIRKQVDFSLMGEPKGPGVPGAPPAADQLNSTSLIMMMMNMQAEARKDAQAQQQFAMEQQRHRDAQMMATLGIIVPVVAPLLFGNREKLADIVGLINANKPEPNSLKDTVETLVSVKTLFNDGGGDKGAAFDADDLVGSIGRLAGPVLGAAGRAFGSARNGASGAHDDEPPQTPAGDGQLHLPQLEAPPADQAAGNPVLDLIRPHVLYFYSANLDPGLAAEAISDIMDREGITQEDLNGLVAAFALSADWKADLAAQGLDLRAKPQWADAFLAELVKAWSDGGGLSDDQPRGTGGVANAGGDEPVSAEGLTVNARKAARA